MQLSELSHKIWQLKYQLTDRGKIIDSTIEDTWSRVAQAVAASENVKIRTFWQKAFYQILEQFRFLPGGRILAGAGAANEVTLFNCFVMDIRQDDLSSVFNALAEAELTLQYGGGVGYNFSVLRPRGDIDPQTGLKAPGPIAMMRLWDTMSASLQSRGARRGAMMAVLDCHHPDIEAFVTAKAGGDVLRHFNLSVMVTDAFMQAVQQDDEWQLVYPDNGKVYRAISARELWQKIIKSAYDYAEPGVLFSDRMNAMNNLFYCQQIIATNPCGEIPMQAYGACNLGSINLPQFVVDPFSPKATINWQALQETASVASRFLDNVIDISRYPLEQQQEQAHGTRRVGLGITGLADMFIMLGLQYSSQAAQTLASRVMRSIAHASWQTSIELAREKGSFDFYKPAYLQGEFVKTLPDELQAQLKKHGVRNSHHNAIAPTGTISLLANNVSNGIEPVFRASYQRQMRTSSGELEQLDVMDYACHLWQQRQGAATLPACWQDVASLTPDDHLNLQAAMQPYVDNAISKTINLSADFPFEKLGDVYTKAYQLGLKGCTIFRPNSVTGSVLSDNQGMFKPCCIVK